MRPDPAQYEGRVPAFVKHTFLSQYLPALCQKVSSVFDEFVYIDGFAGPWMATDTHSFTDTSFGIALDAMSATREFQETKRQRAVKMTAYLVEKDDHAFEELRLLAGRHHDISVQPLHGRFEDHFKNIVAALPANAFVFSLIDPKGMKLDLRSLHSLIARKNSEVLINFMYDFVSRFVDHPNGAIAANMKALLPHVDWDTLAAQLQSAGSAVQREKLIIDAFRTSVKREGHFNFVPSLTVQKTLADRTLYHLVFGTRSPTGLEVFRSSQVKALTAQAAQRSKAKDEKVSEVTGQGSLWRGAEREAHDFSTQQIEQGMRLASQLAEHLISAHPRGITWKHLWPRILDECVVTKSDLGRSINSLRKHGRISAPGWPSEKKVLPLDDQLLVPAHLGDFNGRI